jgi:hypothetical protein
MESWKTILYLQVVDEEGVYEIEPPDAPGMKVGQRFDYDLARVASPKQIQSQQRRQASADEHRLWKEYEDTSGTWYVEEVFWKLDGVWIQCVILTRHLPRRK